MNTPFKFLANCPPEDIHKAHSIIMNPDHSNKYTLILSLLRGGNIEDFKRYMYQKRWQPPSDALAAAPKISNAVFKIVQDKKWEEFPSFFGTLSLEQKESREILEKWYYELDDSQKLHEIMFNEARMNLSSFLGSQEPLSLLSDYQKAQVLESPGPSGSTPTRSFLRFSFPCLSKSHKKEKDIRKGTGSRVHKTPKSSPINTSGSHTVKSTKKCLPKSSSNVLTAERDILISNELMKKVASVTNESKPFCINIRDSSFPNVHFISPEVRNSFGSGILWKEKSCFPIDGSYSRVNSQDIDQAPSTKQLSVQAVPQHISKDNENLYNVLLLGETGVGKTTFINSIANYLKYENLDTAWKEEPVILIPSSFIVTGANLTQYRIMVEANVFRGEQSSKNEDFNEEGNSQTQEPLVHSIDWVEKGILKTLQIIDTPGVNDTRGSDQDETNFEKVLTLIQKLGSLNAVCILLKPNESRLTQGFRDCLNNILVKLHRSVTKNILFCFTNTRSTLYRPGDTMATLTKFLDQLEKNTGVVIKPNKHNIFCFDNDCFRYLCVLLKRKEAYERNIHVTFSDGWIHNLEQTRKLLEKIQGMLAHRVEDTVNINKTRSLIIGLARPLTEISQTLLADKRKFEIKIKEAKELDEKGEKLSSIVTQTKTVLKRRNLGYPRTVCTNFKCNRYVKDDNHQVTAIPKLICHHNCDANVEADHVGYSEIRRCVMFDRRGKCKVCGCDWEVHMHITYELEKHDESVASFEEQQSFKECKDNKQRLSKILECLNVKLENVKNEYDLIKECCYEFSAFLKHSSMMSGVDPYFDYLSQAISVEENKATFFGNKQAVLDLKVILKQYNNGVKYIMEELKENRRSPMTSEELWNKIGNLRKMKMNGELISGIVDSLTWEQ